MLSAVDRDPLANDQDQELTDDQVAVINDNLPLAYAIARDSKERRLDPDDRRQAACLGLIRAVQTHDPAKGTLATHAAWCIRGAIQQAARKANPMASIEAMDGFEPLDRADPVEIDPEDALRLRAVVFSLPEQARLPIIDQFYRGKAPRGGRVRDFKAGVEALKRATQGGERIPKTAPHWIDARTGAPYAAVLPSRDDMAALDAMRRLRLMPVFPTVFTPTSECPHDGPIPKGSLDYCAVCDASGQDGIAIPVNVAPLPLDKPKPPPAPPKKESRRERRRRQQGKALAKAG